MKARERERREKVISLGIFFVCEEKERQVFDWKLSYKAGVTIYIE